MYEGGQCSINRAIGRYGKDKDGKLICVKLPDKYDRTTKPQRNPEKYREFSQHEWELGGPLSDAQLIKEAAYHAYLHELTNAWRR